MVGHACDGFRLLHNDGEFLAAFRIPEASCFVFRTGEDATSINAECRTGDPGGMPLEVLAERPVLDAPEPDDFTAGYREDGLLILVD